MQQLGIGEFTHIVWKLIKIFPSSKKRWRAKFFDLINLLHQSQQQTLSWG